MTLLKARWLDPHQTMLAIHTSEGVAHMSGRDPRIASIRAACPIEMPYKVLGASYADEEHMSMVAQTAEKGAVVVSERDTPDMWAYIRSRFDVAPFRTKAAPEERKSSMPFAAPAEEQERTPWSLKDLMTRASVPEPAAAPLPPAPQEAPAIEHELFAHSPELPRSEQPEPPAPMLPMPIEDAAPVFQSPAPAPASLSPPPVIEQHSAPASYVTDAERRRQAIERVSHAVAQAGDSQIRYEIAIQAHNGNVDALEMLQEEAAIYGATASSLAGRIIAQRALQEQRVMRAYAAKARALINIEAMSGVNIDEAAEAAVRQIKEEGNAGAS